MTNVVKFQQRKKPVQPAKQTRPAANRQAFSAPSGSPAKLIVLAVCIVVVAAGIFAPAIFSMLGVR